MLGKQLKEAQTSLKLMEPPEKDWVSLTMVSTFRFVFLLDSCLVRDASIVSLASGSRRQGRAQGGREVGRSTARSSAGRCWHLTSIISSVTDDLPLLRAHFSWHNLAQVVWEGSRLPCCGCIGGRCSRRAFCLRRLPCWRLVARA